MSFFGRSVVALLVIVPLDPGVAFVPHRAYSQFNGKSSSSPFSLLRATETDTVERLINVVDSTKDETFETDVESNEDTVEQLIKDLDQGSSAEGTSNDDDPTRFDPLLGLYDVSFVLTANKNDNPVGGKWTRKSGFAQKILRTRRTFQHLLPTNTTGLGNPALSSVVAEAVNVISLDALWGLIRFTVILRGDAVPLEREERLSNKIPLSNLAVRAFFDPPRIVFGKQGRLVNICVGPTSSVVLDSTCVDERIRIGMGGTSGTRFVFVRCPDKDKESLEWKALLSRRPARKSRAFSVLGAIAGMGLYGTLSRPRIRVFGSVVAGFASLLGLGLALSTGGIERDDMSYRKGLENPM